jgi:hypothetical protein
MRNPIPETPWVLELRIPREKKGDYTQAARKRGMKLLPWIIEQCDEAVEKGNMTDGPKTPKNPTLGDEAWKVEWCYELPSVEGTSDADIDRAKYKYRIFMCREMAEKFARICYPDDKFGAVHIYPVTFEDPHADTKYAGIRSQFRWAETGDAIEYSGGDTPA